MQPEVWARRPFIYDGLDLSRGAIFRPQGLRNDEKMSRLKYWLVCTDNQLERKVQCHTCGIWFIGVHERDQHHVRKHLSEGEVIRPTAGSKVMLPMDEDGKGSRLTGDRVVGGVEDDSAERAEERRDNELAPLDLSKTKASIDAGVGGIDIQTPNEDPLASFEPEISEEADLRAPVEASEKKVSPKRNRSKKKTRKKTRVLNKKKTAPKRGTRRPKPIDDDDDEA